MAPLRSPPTVSTGDEHTPDWRALELLLMREVMKLVGQSLSPAHVLREMLHLMSELVGLNRGRVVLADSPDAGSVGAQQAMHTASIRHSYGLTQAEAARGTYAWGEGITGRVLATGLPAIVQDVDAEPLFLFRAVKRGQLPVETVAFLALPIAVNGATVGVLACHRIRSRQRHLTDDMALLRVLATLAGQVLQLEQLVAQQTRQLEDRNATLSHALDTHAARYGLIGRSAALLRALGELEQVSASQATVLLLGESGTGKEMFARALHLQSPRCTGPFVKINCGAIPENLFESELFGHERGAYTGAHAARVGRFEQAHGGTLFLDEIGDLPLAMQVKLLRVLQERTVERLGGQGREIAVDVRLVAATHHDLNRQVEQGLFRADLMYRLNVIPVHLPPLRERREDLAELVRHFVSRLNQSHQRNVSVGGAALALLCGHAWPGNIRQLANVLERLVLLSGDGELQPDLVARALASEGTALAPERALTSGTETAAPAVRGYGWVRPEERVEIEAALVRSGGNRARAARELGLTPRQLGYRLKVIGIA